MRRLTTILLATLLTTAAAHAQVQLDKRRAAPAKGEVYVENSLGSVKVVGWDKEQVTVTGKLAPGAEDLDFDGDEEGVYIDVDVPESWFYESDDDTDFQTHLVVHVPFGSSLSLETVNASIEVSDGFVGMRTGGLFATPLPTPPSVSPSRPPVAGNGTSLPSASR